MTTIKKETVVSTTVYGIPVVIRIYPETLVCKHADENGHVEFSIATGYTLCRQNPDYSFSFVCRILRREIVLWVNDDGTNVETDNDIRIAVCPIKISVKNPKMEIPDCLTFHDEGKKFLDHLESFFRIFLF